jgi:hypothetical protein
VLPINRTGDVVDAAVDVLGMLVGLVGWRFLRGRSSSS